jgi:hypothetical protein
MANVVAGLISDQSHPRKLFLYRALRSRWARFSISERYCQTCCGEDNHHL